jgi:hypothetical protein
MIIERKTETTHCIKEYDWELFSSEESNEIFCIWANHHPKKSTVITVSSAYDPFECVELNSVEAIDELINRLNKAKEIFK